MFVLKSKQITLANPEILKTLVHSAFRLKNNDENQFDVKAYHLVKFFINSYVAMQNLEDKNLRKLLPFKLSKYGFKWVMLPQMMNFLNEQITLKLKNSIDINMITDIWTNSSMTDFLALAVVNIDHNLL